MKKTKESIEAKRRMKLKVLNSQQLDKLINAQAKNEERCWADAERLNAKLDRKFQSYMNKKELEYKRKCANEIRKLEWKKERVYKKREKKFNKTEFVMELMQENSKLRDTDREWNWFCISCNKLKTWSELAWWHRYSRSIKNICTVTENINAQCHSCNRTTWPRGDTVAKEKCNRLYDENLDKKYWKWTSRRLCELKVAYLKNTNGTTYGLIVSDELIEDAIKENELRWKNKDFYKPKKKRREIRDSKKKTLGEDQKKIFE